MWRQFGNRCWHILPGITFCRAKLIIGICLVLFVALAPRTSSSQERMSLLERFEAGEMITGEAFARLAGLKTLTYFLGGVENYREYYPNATGAVSLHYQDGSCETGIWYAEGDLICFDWENSGLVCSRWVIHEGLVLSRIENAGQPAIYIEPVIAEDTKPLLCASGMVGTPGGSQSRS